MRLCLVLLSGVLALPVFAEIKISKPFQYQGMCDASAGVAIDAHLFAVADDAIVGVESIVVRARRDHLAL